ncbi:MAG: nucleoside hydrolase [Treponema sp.]|jgi:inosine-uridine nucleoside N-ribohydrolase|nr:nucleoside hydrolase [Treponema sp.]
MPLNFTVRPKKQIRVIIDTDADCEADDPFAITHALISPKLIVKAIFAEHFNSEGSTKRSYDEIQRILTAMELSVPVFMGAEGPLSIDDETALSPASEYLIEEASKNDPMPLFVLCIGAITNVAVAIKVHPEIGTKMTIVWIAGHDYARVEKVNFKEYNSGNDIIAGNIIFDGDVELWQIPLNVYGSVRIGLAELQKRVYPCGKIGRHLFEKMVKYNGTDMADWTAGESWSLGDSPAVGVAIDENCGKYEYREAPVLNEDTSYTFKGGRRKIRVYTSIDSRFVLEDFMAKLELLYGKKYDTV